MKSSSPSITTTFGQRLECARLAWGWTQSDLAGRLGTTQVAISQYEANKRIPKANRISSIAAIAMVDDRWLGTGWEDSRRRNVSKQAIIDAESLQVEGSMLSEGLGVTENYLNAVKTGKILPDSSFFQQLMDFLSHNLKFSEFDYAQESPVSRVILCFETLATELERMMEFAEQVRTRIDTDLEYYRRSHSELMGMVNRMKAEYERNSMG